MRKYLAAALVLLCHPAIAQDLGHGTPTECVVPGLNVPLSAVPLASGQEASGLGFELKLNSEYGALSSMATGAARECGDQIITAINSMPRAAAIATMNAILPPDRATYGFTVLTGTWVDFLTGADRAKFIVTANWKISTNILEDRDVPAHPDSTIPQYACTRDLQAGLIKSALAFVKCVWMPTEAVAVKYHVDDLDILRAMIATDEAAAARLDRGEISKEDLLALIAQADVRANSEKQTRAAAHPASPGLDSAKPKRGAKTY